MSSENLKTVKPDDADARTGLILFFLWPASAFLFSLFHLDRPFARLIVILFFGLFGYTFVAPFQDIDSNRHKQYFLEAAQRPFSDFYGIVAGLYTEDGIKPDFVQNFIYFSLSRFTSDSKYLFLVIALLLGWLLMLNVKVHYRMFEQNKNFYTWLFLVFIFILIPPFRIVSFRQYLADMVFLFGIYQFYETKKLKFLIVAISSIFIHFGFFLVVPFLFLHLLLGNREYVFYVAILASFFLNDQIAGVLQDLGVDLGGGFEERSEGYISEKYLERINYLKAQRNVLLDNYIQWTSFCFLFCLIYLRITLREFEGTAMRLYCFTLLLFSVINITRDLPFISDRFGVLFIMLGCLLFLRLFSVHTVKPNLVFSAIIVLCFVVNFIILLRLNIMYSNIVIATPLLPIALFYDPNYSILDLLK